MPSSKLRRELLKETHNTKCVVTKEKREHWRCSHGLIISGFPKVEGFRSTLVVVDRFSKYVVFIPALSECPTEEAAHIFFSNVVKHFGMPEDTVSNRDTRFTSRF